jgi:hypothetical protein
LRLTTDLKRKIFHYHSFSKNLFRIYSERVDRVFKNIVINKTGMFLSLTELVKMPANQMYQMKERRIKRKIYLALSN